MRYGLLPYRVQGSIPPSREDAMTCTDRIAQYGGGAALPAESHVYMRREDADAILDYLRETPVESDREYPLIVALADALGHELPDWMRHRAAAVQHVPADPPTYLPR